MRPTKSPRTMAPARPAILVLSGLMLAPAVGRAQARPQPTARSRPTSSSSSATITPIQAISAYNDPRRLIETPHIDRLAREGMRFDRCVVPNSICGPSRATVLTGKYSHQNGFYNNTNSRFDGSQTTFPKLLHAAGYQTAIFGKWHLVTDPTGFDEWQILPGQGVYYNPAMIHNGQRAAAVRLHHRHHHRPEPRLAAKAATSRGRSCSCASTRPPTASGCPLCATWATTTTAVIPSRPRSSTTTPAAARPSTTRT